MDNNFKNPKKFIKGIAILFLIFFVGGVGGVYFDQKVLPFIKTNKYLSRINFLKRSAENVTVINKTEQVIIKEDDSINEIASQASNAVVNIVSIAKAIDQSGTGVIVTSDGLIMTHRKAIIEKDAEYKVFLFNGNYYEAKIVGIDEFSDLAFLKIDVPNLTVISFANSADVRPGKKLVAIGNSFGEYQNRYAAGLLSNINKTFNLGGMAVALSEKLEGVFESDFASQKEYLGGPVIGYSGDLIGIIGLLTINGQDKYFQIPANVAKESMDFILQNGTGVRPSLGAYYVPITKEYSIAHKLTRDRGALIFSPSGKQGLSIISGLPAEKAGLRINDIIISVDGQNVNLDNPFSNLVNQHKKGDKIELTVERNGEEIKIPVQL